MGNLETLRSLNLSGNQLTGEIPSELAGLENLDDLDLSNNQLSGKIPSEFCTRQELDFRFSGNQLEVNC